MPSMNMPAMSATARVAPVQPGVYRGSVRLPMAGRWDLMVNASRRGEPLGSSIEPISVQ
jgi:hypothetical protein